MGSANVAPLTGPAEPTPDTLRDPLQRYLLATRPPFLTITLVGCVLGVATAYADGQPLALSTALVTILLALMAHAAVNVHNDYCDHLNGTDAANHSRVFPFTGGSRFIQNGVMSADAMRRYALMLYAATVLGGLALVWMVGWGLVLIGLVGVLTGWAYSADPLRLNSRGLGEICVALTFWLVVVGADFVQRGSWSATPMWAGIGYALLTTNILYLNQFPDRDADISAGKLHWVARLPLHQARWGYVLILALALLGVVLPALFGALPRGAALGVVAALPAILATKTLMAHAGESRALTPAIQQTIAAAHLAAVAMAVGLWWRP